MSLKAKQIIIALFSVVTILVLGFVIVSEKAHEMAERHVVIKPDSEGCIRCHGKVDEEGKPGRDPGIVQHWLGSVHAEQGVGCVDCHGVPAPGGPTGKLADEDNPRFVVQVVWDKSSGLKTSELVKEGGQPRERPDIWKHEGTEIITNVSPRACARCHEKEAAQFFNSRHASASQFIGSVDNFLGRFAEGPAAANNGCQQCHGSQVRMSKPAEGDDAPEYAADVWPNTGVGRINLDGSWGSCTACHSRHAFAAGVARRPDNCGKCHMGPDHPQLEIFYESKHGIAYRANEDELGLDNPGNEWVLGQDYTAAPTCSSCHMGSVAPAGNYQKLETTHDVGARISWTLRPKISIQPKGIKDKSGKLLLAEPQDRRATMQQACQTCHSTAWVSNFYIQYDEAVALYNNKFGKPLVAIYGFLKEQEIIDEIPMNEEMDFAFFEIWHHEGRRARHGASMMGPDYTQWHGFYELSKNFYTHFLPLARELAAHAEKSEITEAFIAQTLRGDDGKDWEKYHRWQEGLSASERSAMLSWEQETYESRK